jgi:hypothetical protein
MAALDGKLVLFGGSDCSGSYPDPSWTCNNLADTWLFDGAAWTQVFPAESPPARNGGVMAPLGGILVLYGGATPNASPNCGLLDDTWTWDGSNWTQLSVSGPSALEDSVMAPLGTSLVLVGGTYPIDGLCGAGSFAQTGLWNGTSWSERNVRGPEGDHAVMAPLCLGSSCPDGGAP